MVAPPRSLRRWLCMVTWCASATASAQSACDAGDAGPDPSEVGTVRDVFPGDMARDVPRDAPVRIRYIGRAPSTPTLCVHRANSLTCLPGEVAFTGVEIAWRSRDGALDAFADYRVSFSDGEGSNETRFTTGASTSAGPPEFRGIRSVDVEPIDGDPCGTAAAITVKFERVRAYVSPGATAWPEGDLEYVIYETRGPGVSGPVERDRARLQRSGSSGDTVGQRTFRLSPRDAAGPVCFTMRVLDPLGRGAGDSGEVCVNPAAGNYFAGCAATPGRTRGALAWALAAAFAWRRRKILAMSRRCD